MFLTFHPLWIAFATLQVTRKLPNTWEVSVNDIRELKQLYLVRPDFRNNINIYNFSIFDIGNATYTSNTRTGWKRNWIYICNATHTSYTRTGCKHHCSLFRLHEIVKKINRTHPESRFIWKCHECYVQLKKKHLHCNCLQFIIFFPIKCCRNKI